MTKQRQKNNLLSIKWLISYLRWFSAGTVEVKLGGLAV